MKHKLIMESWRRFCEQTKISPAAAMAKYGKVHNTTLRVKKFVRLAKAYADKKKETLENVLISPEIEHFFGNDFWSGGIHSGTSACGIGKGDEGLLGLRDSARKLDNNMHPEWKEFIPAAARESQHRSADDYQADENDYLISAISTWYDIIMANGCGKSATLQAAIIFLAKQINRPIAGVIDPE